MQMSKRRLLQAMGATLLCSSLVSLPVQAAEDKRSYILATASTGGTYYPVGVALATLTTVKLEPKFNMAMSAINSAGSGENIKLLRENEAQFAILQGLYGAWAWNGEAGFAQAGPQKHLRSVSMLWQNVEHFSLRTSKVKEGTIMDLEQLDGKFSIGEKNSGTEGSGRTILTNLGLPVDKLDFAHLSYSAGADALQNGTIDGMNTPAGVPVGAVTQAFAALGSDLTLLNFTDEQVLEANGYYNLWTRYVIPANTYPGQSKEVQTIAQPNFLAVRDDVSEEDVYQLTKAIYENLPFLNGIHKATQGMSLQDAMDGLPVPLHPGAARYYREMGLTIPAHLEVK
ncbi:TAXI family TRAP transporter solute-binding subunit [Balneatrix alpica]|uniref:TAXI family TRAP transporter solute-binding subunit n=1 Tax=Balneatrix alpica TaxID=75684 RepID=UPI002738527E|nr:TAXI family TRAP transporter solute-binding subunit [Balneatrix alpica]